MNITSAIYSIARNKVVIKQPFEITDETKKVYYVGCHRYLKEEIGRPILRSITNYPYVEITMIDATESELRKALSDWLIDRAFKVREEDVDIAE